MDKITVLMQKAALEAGNTLVDLFSHDHTIQNKKSHQDIVTEADTKSQQIIQDILMEGMIDLGFEEDSIGFIGEERLRVKGKHLFVIDPLDGTTSYAAGIPYFSISIAYMHDGQVVSGVIYDPMHQTYYIAEDGKGAIKMRGDMQTSLMIRQQDIQSLIVVGGFNSGSWKKQFAVYETLYPQVRGIRNAGSGALDLALFATNVYGLIINGGCYIWDIAAALLIIKESGGTLVDWKGVSVQLDVENPDRRYQIIACQNSFLPEILRLIKEQ